MYPRPLFIHVFNSYKQVVQKQEILSERNPPVLIAKDVKFDLYGVKSTMPVSMLDLVFKALFDVYLICPIAQKVSEKSLNIVEHNVCLDLGNNVSEI